MRTYDTMNVPADLVVATFLCCHLLPNLRDPVFLLCRGREGADGEQLDFHQALRNLDKALNLVIEIATTGSTAQGCGGTPPVALEWPSSDIEARVHPDDAQRAKLKALQDTSARAAEALKASCQTGSALTPPARLAASAKRLGLGCSRSERTRHE